MRLKVSRIGLCASITPCEFTQVRAGGQGQDRTADLPLFSSKDHRPQLSASIHLPDPEPQAAVGVLPRTNANETGTETRQRVTMADDRLRRAPQHLANRGVHQAPRGDLIDSAHPAAAGAAPGATPPCAVTRSFAVSAGRHSRPGHLPGVRDRCGRHVPPSGHLGSGGDGRVHVRAAADGVLRAYRRGERGPEGIHRRFLPPDLPGHAGSGAGDPAVPQARDRRVAGSPTC